MWLIWVQNAGLEGNGSGELVFFCQQTGWRIDNNNRRKWPITLPLVHICPISILYLGVVVHNLDRHTYSSCIAFPQIMGTPRFWELGGKGGRGHSSPGNFQFYRYSLSGRGLGTRLLKKGSKQLPSFTWGRIASSKKVDIWVCQHCM